MTFFFVFELANTEGYCAICDVVTVAGAGDRVQAEFVGFVVGIGSVWNDANALAFDVVEVAPAEIKGDVVNPANCTIDKQGIVVDDRADERILRLVEVDGNVGVGHGGFFCG